MNTSSSFSSKRRQDHSALRSGLRNLQVLFPLHHHHRNHCHVIKQTSNDGGDLPISEHSARRRQSTKIRVHKANEKKFGKILGYLSSSRVTIEWLLTELYLNRKKHRKEWAGVKRFASQRLIKDLSITDWKSTLEQVEWLPIHAILRWEIKALSRTEAFGQFDPSKSLESMASMVDEKEVREHAPRFLDLLYTVSRPIRYQSQDEKVVNKRLIKPAGAILSTICFNMQKQKSNCFPLNFGIFLHKNGLSRNGLETTCALRLTSSYDTIIRTIENIANETVDEVRQIGELPTAIPAYDSLEFSFGVYDVRDGDMPKFASVTTGLVHKGVEIPAGGLIKAWSRPKYTLQPIDIVPIHDPNRIQQQVGWRNKVKDPARTCAAS
jgi:hypothetical protein